ncbi:MAG: hypothetical protein Q7T60_16750, partial [Sphingopyxis sp.]|nr:hypothetical protein [Sphingopyxis sp.]
MWLKIAAAGFILTVASPAHSEPLAELVYHTIFFRAASGDKQWEKLPISKRATQRTLRQIPPVEGVFVMVELRCEGLERNGALRKCVVQTEPNSGAYKRVGEALAADFRSDSSYARAVRDNVRFISIQVRLSNSVSQLTAGPC